jgi:signal transduction histidine kinase
LAAVGRLAAGVAHEINNPLTGILGFSQRLLRKEVADEVRKDLARVNSEALRAAKVVENLLTFARRHEPKKEYSNINVILEKTLELRAYELRTSNIEVSKHFASALPEALVDYHQMQEVFLNIILNAEQAMTEANKGGKLNIKTYQVDDKIRITFTNNGPAIPAENLDRLFDPFFTTRGGKGGTGLGLSICYGIVTEHGGGIQVSNPSEGTTFLVELPVTTQEKANLSSKNKLTRIV